MKFQSMLVAALCCWRRWRAPRQLPSRSPAPRASRFLIAITDFNGETGVSRALTSVVRADLSAAACSAIEPTGARRRQTAAPTPRPEARGADAGRRHGRHRGRRPLRNPLPACTTRKADGELGSQTFGHASAQIRATAHRIQAITSTRRCSARKAFFPRSPTSSSRRGLDPDAGRRHRRRRAKSPPPRA